MVAEDSSTDHTNTTEHTGHTEVGGFALHDVTPDRGWIPRVVELARLAESEDGDPPFSDQTLVDLRSSPGRVRLVVATPTPAGDDAAAPVAPADSGPQDPAGRPALVAAAVLVSSADAREPSLLEAVVAPEARGRGLGRAVVEAALTAARGPVDAWAHGDHPAARALAEKLGFTPVRELHRLLRTLEGVTEELPVDLPERLGLRSFVVGQDEQAWLEVNAAAFASHPEQGRMTLEDLRQREAEDWFDPQGFLIAYPLNDPETIAGFHWTKVHPATAQEPARGEVHVVGIAPDQQGRGLGRSLTVAGLHHLAGQGLGEVLLYVDAENEPAMGLYRAIGFTPWHVDVMFTRK